MILKTLTVLRQMAQLRLKIWYAVRMKYETLPVDVGAVENRMVVVRGCASLLDRDVAALYGVETRAINQAVRNNPNKFPEGYVFELDKDVAKDLQSKILIAKVSPKSRAVPKVFTERGLYMLATQSSETEIELNFAVVKIRHKIIRK